MRGSWTQASMRAAREHRTTRRDPLLCRSRSALHGASAAVFVGLLSSNDENFKPLDQFFVDAQAGSLPSVSIVEAYFTGDVRADQDDEHPAANIQRGQAFTKRVVDAVMRSPQWPRTAMVLLYDEHGGFYDSQRPPAACEPDDLRPVGDVTGASITSASARR